MRATETSEGAAISGHDGTVPAVDLVAVTRVFGVAPALVRASLRVDQGETLLVRGPNGAGKTTLLKVIATALSPTYGGGTVLGHDLARDRLEIRRRTEYLGHRTRLYEDLTGTENLAFACSLNGADPSGVPAALDRVGLGTVAGDRARTYSQGMRQRVALARSILRAPELLLLDEPYAGLDDDAKDLVDALITEARDAGRTVILATHDLTRGRVAQRAVSMERGRIIDGKDRR